MPIPIQSVVAWPGEGLGTGEDMDYRIFRPTYRDRRGETKRSEVYQIAFTDHLRRRQTIAGERRHRSTDKLAKRILELVECRRDAEKVDPKLRKWIDGLDVKRRARLEEIDLLDPVAMSGEVPLIAHLDGFRDESGKLTAPGWSQEIQASGTTPKHVSAVTSRVRTLLEGCGLLLWRDLIAPGVKTRITVWLGEQRAAGAINGKTFNYYCRDFRRFCEWLAEQLERDIPKTAKIKKVDESDSVGRRSLSVDEMKLLVDAAAAGPVRQGLTGDERAMLYRFAFETGIRPAQIRSLTVASFNLDADPPEVTAHARYVKRRTPHTQYLRPAMAETLRERFAAKMPTAPAFKMPSQYHGAEMLRADLADARSAWLAEPGLSDKQREARHRADFLAPVNHKGEVAVFYSTRHGHGTALAGAGVSESVIAKSMHHASRTTTTRYIHPDRDSVNKAIGTLPDLAPTVRLKATGTADAKPKISPHPANVRPSTRRKRERAASAPAAGEDSEGDLRTSCATGWTPVDAGGQNDVSGIESQTAENPGNPAISGENSTSAPWRNWQTQWIQNPPTTSPKPNENIGEREDAPSVLRPSCAPPATNPELSTTESPDLRELIAAWPELPADVRKMILGVVRLTPRAPRPPP